MLKRRNTPHHTAIQSSSLTHFTVFPVLLSDTEYFLTIYIIVSLEIGKKTPKNTVATTNIWYMIISRNSLLSHRSLLSFVFSFFDLIFFSASVNTNTQLAWQQVSHSVNQTWAVANGKKTKTNTQASKVARERCRLIKWIKYRHNYDYII